MIAKPRVIIDTIPHSEQRYDTCGDYWTDEDGTLQVRISDMGDARYEAMVMIHELVERMLCEARGITNKQIDDFDFVYKGEGEPGDDPAAPYQNEHLIATGIEKMLCAGLGIRWADYEKAVTELKP